MQPMDVKPTALPSRTLQQEPHILVHQPQILVCRLVLLVISKLLVVLALQTLALLALLACLVHTNQELLVMVSFKFLIVFVKEKFQCFDKCVIDFFCIAIFFLAVC